MLKPDNVYEINGVTVNEKIIPDTLVWKDAAKAKAAGFKKGSLYKKVRKLTKNTGKPLFITVHNTSGHNNVGDEGELYTRATYNENMGSARVHFYVDANGAWQMLKAGTAKSPADPEGSAEVGWHAGDGSAADGGNYTSIALEIIMGKKDEKLNSKAYDNGARIIAWLIKKHKLSVNDIVSHTYWVNKKWGKTFADRDTQSTNMIKGKKWCPALIFNSNNQKTAKVNLKKFKELVESYLEEKKEFAEGDKVKIKENVTKYKNGKIIPEWVKKSVLYVRALEKDDTLLLSVEPVKKEYTGRMYSKDVEKVK